MTLSIKNPSQDTTLRSLAKGHMLKTYEWISDPKFRKAFMVRGENSWERHVDYFSNLLTDDTQQGYAIYLDDIHVGNCGFKSISKSEKSAELWIYLGSVDARGLGLGGCALALLIKNGINFFNLTSIYVHVAEDNQAAISLYRSNGFFEDGVCSKEWKDRDANIRRMLWRVE